MQTCRGKQLLYLHKVFERRPKDVWEMSLGDAHILMFYGSPEDFNLTHSVKFYTITFLKDSFGVPPRRVYS